MTLVTPAEADRIEQAIAAAERQTSGEIIAIITRDCGSYLFAPVLWAAIVALLVPWPFIAWTWWPIQTIYGLQIAAFGGLALLLSLRPIRFALVPRSVKHARAHRRAREQFLTQNLHTTAGRTGVLVFVSVAERYAELIADAAIDARVADGEWKEIVDRLTRLIKEGRPGDGFVAAVEAIGVRLARHFPPSDASRDELPNHLIVLGSD